MRQFLTKIFAWADRRWWVKILVVPIFATMPPILLGLTKWNPELEKYLIEHPNTLGILVLWPFFAIFVAVLNYHFKPPKLISSTDLSILLEVLHRIVAAKLNRFSEAVQHFQKNDRAAKKVFSKITQPEQQIEDIVQGIHYFFEAIRPSDVPITDLVIRVSLARMGAQHIEDFVTFYPPGQRPRSKIKALQCDESGFSRAKALKRIVIAEDIFAENTAGPSRCYVVTDESRCSENGLMICYPVIVSSTQDVPYVISVCTARPNHFKRCDGDFYAKMLEYFAQRISLEHCLKSLKALTR